MHECLKPLILDVERRSVDPVLQYFPSRSRLENSISLRDPLVQLTEHTDWEYFIAEFGRGNGEAATGQPPNPTRPMADPLYLEQACGLSNQAPVGCWVEPSSFHFCFVERDLQHQSPLHPTNVNRYRSRPSEADGGELLRARIGVADRADCVRQPDKAQVPLEVPTMEEVRSGSGVALTTATSRRDELPVILCTH